MQSIKYYAEEAGVSPIFVLAVAHCESRFTSNAKNINKNETTDWGVMQINSIHWKQAKALGYDVVNNAIDNIRFGIYLIKKNGHRDYLASAKCVGRYNGQGLDYS